MPKISLPIAHWWSTPLPFRRTIIYASGQFTPALNGTVARVYNSGKIADANYQAAQAAINGETTVGGALHFRRVNGREGIVIGAHVFW